MRSCPPLSKEVVLVLAAVLLLASSSSSTFSVAFPSPNQPSRRPPTSSSSNDNNKMEEIEKQVSEWNIIDKQKNTRRRPQHKPWKLPSVQYIPPPDDDPQFEPFMLLLVGMPGSGKSTFAKALVEAMPYKVCQRCRCVGLYADSISSLPPDFQLSTNTPTHPSVHQDKPRRVGKSEKVRSQGSHCFGRRKMPRD